MSDDLLKTKLYAVRDKNGLYFTKSNSYEDSWVKDFKKARIYTRIGDARKIVTMSEKYHSECDDDIPDIVVLDIVGSRVIDDRERQEVRTDKKEEREKRLRIKKAKDKLEEAEKELKRETQNESCNKL